MNDKIGFCRIWQRVSVYTNSVTNDIPYTDEESHIEKVRVPSNSHECKHLFPLLEGLSKGTTVYADKDYDSATTGSTWKNIVYRTILCTKLTAAAR